MEPTSVARPTSGSLTAGRTVISAVRGSRDAIMSAVLVRLEDDAGGTEARSRRSGPATGGWSGR